VLEDISKTLKEISKILKEKIEKDKKNDDAK
jgi:hypothetical protein